MKSQISNLKKDNEKLEKKAVKAMEAENDQIIELESKNYPEWNEFEFITRKYGAYGPSKAECLQYYSGSKK